VADEAGVVGLRLEGDRAQRKCTDKKKERLTPRWFLGALRRCK